MKCSPPEVGWANVATRHDRLLSPSVLAARSFEACSARQGGPERTSFERTEGTTRAHWPASRLKRTERTRKRVGKACQSPK